MRKDHLIEILEVAGNISLEALSNIASNFGLDWSMLDLIQIKRMVDEGELVMTKTKGHTTYGLPQVAVDFKKISEVLVDEFGYSEDFSLNKATKVLGMRNEDTRNLMLELERQGRVKHVRDGKFMGQPYPIFRNLK